MRNAFIITGRHRITCYIFTMLWITTILAQAPDTSWTKTFGGPSVDMAYSVKHTADNGFIAAGYTRSCGAGGADVYVIKTDSLGCIQWEKTYGGSLDDAGWSIAQSANGDYIIAGLTASYGHGGDDVYVIKTDPAGDTLWTRTFGGAAIDQGYSMVQSPGGGIVIAGVTSSFSGSNDVYVIKVDASGNLLWEKVYGGPEEDRAYAVDVMPDGGFIAAGHTRSFGAGAQDVYVLRLDSLGDTLWTRTYGGVDHYTASGIAATFDSGAITVGITDSYGAIYGDYYIVRIDKFGDTLWTRHYGGDVTEWGHAIRQRNDGSFIAAGWSDSYWPGSQMYIFRLNASGDTVWTKLLAGDGYAAGFALDLIPEGGSIIAGSTDSSDMGANEDVYLVKINEELYGGYEYSVRNNSSCRPSSTILYGALRLPAGKNYQVYDITGRITKPQTMRSGIYFIKADGKIIQKIIKIK